MRSALIVSAGVAIVVVTSVLDWRADTQAGRPASPGLVPRAFARQATATEELARRFAWPASDAFLATHGDMEAVRPIALVGGRAIWWAEPESGSGGLPKFARLDELVAHGKEIVHRTRVLDDRVRMEGRGQELPEVIWGLRRKAGSEAIAFMWSPGDRQYGWDDILPMVPMEKWFEKLDQSFVHRSEETTFVFIPTSSGSAAQIDQRAWEDWSYTTTLLALDQPLYEPLARERPKDYWAAQAMNQARLEVVKEAMETSVPAGLDAIRSAVAENVPLDDFGWGGVADFAEKNGDIALTLAVRARHKPVGRCSMDIGPQEAARSYADLCFAAGRLGCFLNLQVKIMGDQFERMAYSSFGEAAHETHVDHLRDIGIDVEKFLRGLLYQFDAPHAERLELDPWRLARSFLEAKLDDRMSSLLRSDTSRPDLDLFNRFRAAQTLAYLRFQDEKPGRFWRPEDEQERQKRIRDIRAELETLGLAEPAASWVRAFGSE